LRRLENGYAFQPIKYGVDTNYKNTNPEKYPVYSIEIELTERAQKNFPLYRFKHLYDPSSTEHT
jgi:hypothetical protein